MPAHEGRPMIASIVLAVVGALLFAASAAIQHYAAGRQARRLAAAAQAGVPAQRAVDAPDEAAGTVPEAVPAGRVLGAATAGTARPAGGHPSGAFPSAAGHPAGVDSWPPLVEAAPPVALAVEQDLLGPPRRTSLARRPVQMVTLLLRLARDPLWLLGWVTNLAGFAAQAVALHLGSIVIVQALLVTQLLFALPLSTLPQRRRPLRRDWLGTAAVSAGLALLINARGTVPQATGRPNALWLVVAGAAVLIALLLWMARLVRPRGPQYRTAAVAAAAGICFCLTAVFLVVLGNDLAARGDLSDLIGWPLLGLAASTLLGMLLVQDAFASGSLPAAMTAMTITDPVASGIAGTILFDRRPPLHPGALAGALVAVGLIAVGVAALANSPTLRGEDRSPGTR
jgi:drug/metabolite transporter (DMT)-like permease